MSETVDERLYQLVPSIYRLRDAAQGEPLRALLDIIQGVHDEVEADIEELYDNWFIGTCDEWVVPYIGDLLGVRGLYSVSPTTFSQRARVANTIGYRRRKGTAAMLELLARDVTDWPAHVVEFFRQLETTQYLNHLRLTNVRTPDLRDTNALELLGGPFEQVAHTADVRHIDIGRGKYNIANIGLFLWRLQSYPITKGTALPDPSGGYRFSPLGSGSTPPGYDEPLFNQPQANTGDPRLPSEPYVPGMLRRRALYDELDARRQALAENTTPRTIYFGDTPVLRVYLDGATNDSVPPEQILICDLTTWQRPPAQIVYTASDGSQHAAPIRVSVDPKLGRLMPVAPVAAGTDVLVSYSYGFSGDVGGGPYTRQDSAAQALSAPVSWQRAVTKDVPEVPGQRYNTLGAAIADWNALTAPTAGVIAITDSRTYVENIAITIPQGSQLLIVAAEWPDTTPGHFNADGVRPHLRGGITVTGSAPAGTSDSDALALSGLVIEGSVTVSPGNLGALRLTHCTVVPGAGGVTVNADSPPGKRNDRLSVTLTRCVTGPIGLPQPASQAAARPVQIAGPAPVPGRGPLSGLFPPRVALTGAPLAGVSGAGVSDAAPFLTITDSIVASAREPADYTGAAVTAPFAAATLNAVTVLGTCAVRSLSASNCIFAGVVTAARRQIGCVRFCYVPDGSKVPRRYRCQPALALSTTDDAQEQARVLAYLRPLFTSRRYGDPAYAQLDLAGPTEIATGADDQGEMGAFHFLMQPQRVANLRTSLEEYLRFGLEAGIFFVT